jgi:hypothetical protein
MYETVKILLRLVKYYVFFELKISENASINDPIMHMTPPARKANA